MAGNCHSFMKFLFIFSLILFALILTWHFLTRKYLNPYKLYVIFGPKGVGKSTLLQKLAAYYIKRGFNVYCNIGDCNIEGVQQIPIEDLPRLAAAGHQLYHYKKNTLAMELKEYYEKIPLLMKKGISSPSHRLSSSIL